MRHQDQTPAECGYSREPWTAPWPPSRAAPPASATTRYSSPAQTADSVPTRRWPARKRTRSPTAAARSRQCETPGAPMTPPGRPERPATRIVRGGHGPAVPVLIPAARSRPTRRWGRPGRTQPPCGRDRSRCRESRRPGHPARLWPPSPRLAGHANVRRHAAVGSAEPRSLALKRVQTEVPSGLAASGEDSIRHHHPGNTSPPLRASLAGNLRARPAASAAYHHTSADYQRVSRCVTASA